MTDPEIFRDLLQGTVCICSASKKRGMSFCAGDYGRLPEGLQRALYHREDYPAAYRRAMAQLGFAEPPGAAPDRGPVARTADLFPQTHK